MLTDHSANTRDWALAAVMQGLRLAAIPAIDAIPGAASGRSTFRLSWHGESGHVEVYAKVYGAGEAWSHVHRMRRVEAALRDQDACLRVPPVLHVEATGRCMVQRRAHGLLLAEHAGGPALYTALERSGAALARLHALEPELVDPPLAAGDVRALGSRETQAADQLDIQMRELMRPHPRDLAQAYPSLAGSMQTLIETMSRVASQLGLTPVTLLHRDAHPRQFFVANDKVELIDWDLAGAGDPALDVANLLAHVGKRWPAVAPAAQRALLAGYGGLRAAALLDRLPLYTAFHHLRRACKAHRLGADGLEVRERLAAAERTIESGAVLRRVA